MLDVTMIVHAGEYQVIMNGTVLHVDNTTHMIWLSTPEGVACVPMAMVTSMKNGDDMWFSAEWAGVAYPATSPNNPFLMNPNTVPDGILSLHEDAQEGVEIKPMVDPNWLTNMVASKPVMPSISFGNLK
jgi:hypothetical protein